MSASASDTFVDEPKDPLTRGVPTPAAPNTPAAIAGESNTAWGTYLNSLNSKYQDKIKRMAQLPNYQITMRTDDGREEKQLFTRKKLLQWQFDEIEDLRAQATELAATSARESQKALSTMYKKAATYMLWNPRQQQPMTEDEYRHAVFADIRPALDSAMLISLISDPN